VLGFFVWWYNDRKETTVLIPEETYKDFMTRLDEIEEALDKGVSPYPTMAAVGFAALERDVDALFERGRITDVENPGFVERLLEVWQKFQ